MDKMMFSGLFGEVLVPPMSATGTSAVYRAFNLAFTDQHAHAIRTYLTTPGTLIPIEKPSVALSTHGVRLGETGYITSTIQQ